MGRSCLMHKPRKTGPNTIHVIRICYDTRLSYMVDLVNPTSTKEHPEHIDTSPEPKAITTETAVVRRTQLFFGRLALGSALSDTLSFVRMHADRR
jgi:hypothetical protein